MPEGNGSAQSEIAAVDRLQQTINAAVRALDSNVGAVLTEALNFLSGAQAELKALDKRIEAARGQIGAARQEWQRGGTAIQAPAPPAEQVGPPAAPAFLKAPKQEIAGRN